LYQIGKNNILNRDKASCKNGKFWSVVPPTKQSLFRASCNTGTFWSIAPLAKPSLFDQGMRQNKHGTFWSVVPLAKPSLFDQALRQNTQYWVEMKAKPAYFVSNRQKQHIE
jgi:hypothetical protein